MSISTCDARHQAGTPTFEVCVSPHNLAYVGHELRTPLNALLGFARLLHDAGPTAAADRNRYLSGLEIAADHLSTMVGDLMDLPRIQNGTMSVHVTRVMVSHIAEEAVALIEPAARQAGIEVVMDGGDPAVCVGADRLRLRQVLLNLLSNAVKYDRRGRCVRVHWHCDAVGAVVRISVRDFGAGLRPDQIDHLFEPFNRLGTERSTEGIGLGLVIARGLLRMMDGDIEVESEPDAGSTFTIVLPSAPSEADATR